jgi:hypothetical protein
VAPEVRDALAAMTQYSAGQAKDLAKVLSWDQSGRGLNHPKSWWETFVKVSRYILPLIPRLCLFDHLRGCKVPMETFGLDDKRRW